MAGTTASVTSGITNSPMVGVKDFHVAKMLTDPSTGKATYEDSISFPWVRQIQIKPKNNEATLYGDNMSVATANDTSEYDLTIEVATLPVEYKAFLLGHTYDKTTGTIKATADDAAPYFMVMFSSTKQNGKNRFVRFAKVLFSEPDETSKTKEASVSFNTPSMSAKAIYRTSDKVVYEQADEEADGYVATTGTNWFVTNPSA